MDKNLTLRVNGLELRFCMTLPTYNRYLNELQPTSKVAPAHNLCMRTVEPDSRAALQDLLALPGVGVQLAAQLVAAYTPDVEIELGE